MKKKRNKFRYCTIALIVVITIFLYIRNLIIIQVKPEFDIKYYEGLLEISFFEQMPKYQKIYGNVSTTDSALEIVKDILRKEIGFLRELNERPYTIVKSTDNEYYFVTSVMLNDGRLGGGYYSFIIRKKDGVVVWWEPK